MIQDAVNDILSIIEKVPHLAMWVLAGLLLYKIVYIGSIFGIIRLAIKAAQDGYKSRLEHNEKKARIEAEPKPELFDVSGYFITGKNLKEQFLSLIAETKVASQGSGQKLNYLHQSDIDWFRDAVKEKRERETR